MNSHPILRGLARVIFWTYPRGSWQYDILCALILAFIFLTPPSVFEGEFFSDQGTRPSATADEEGGVTEVRHDPPARERTGTAGSAQRVESVPDE